MSEINRKHSDMFVRFPFGKAEVANVAAGAAIAYATKNSKTILTIGEMGAAGTLNVSVHPEQAAGDELIVKVSADGTNRALTLGTGVTGNAYTVNANKSAVLTFVFDGASFVLTSTNQLN
jgi:hypothetical protein